MSSDLYVPRLWQPRRSMIVNPYAHGGGGGGGGWDPSTDLDNILVLLESTSLSGTTDGAAVGTWTDESVNGNDYVQATGSKQPLWRAGATPTGEGALEFDNTDDAMSPTSALSVTAWPWTFVVCYSPLGGSDGRRMLSGSNNWLMGPYNGQIQHYAGGFSTGGTYTIGNWYTQIIAQETSNELHRVNGTTVTTNPTNGAPGNVHLGAAGAYSEPPYSQCCFLLITSDRLTSTEIAELETYLSATYGV